MFTIKKKYLAVQKGGLISESFFFNLSKNDPEYYQPKEKMLRVWFVTFWFEICVKLKIFIRLSYLSSFRQKPLLGAELKLKNVHPNLRFYLSSTYIVCTAL